MPTYVSATGTAFSTDTTDHSANYPATVNSGDLLVYLVASLSSSTVTTPTGLDLLGTDAQTARCSVYARVSDGTEGGGTVNFVTSSATTAVVYIVRISGFSGTIATDIDITIAAAGLTATPNPGSVTAGWGSDTNLFITFTSAGDDDETVSAYPTNYINGNTLASGGGPNAGCSMQFATRNLTSASDDPGTFTLTNSEGCVAGTLVIKPDGGGGPVANPKGPLGMPLHGPLGGPI